MDLPASLSARFEPLGLLGQGGFGAVWRCRDRELDRDVAVKLLALGDDPEAVARFQREARVTASLHSPRVVEVYDHGVADGVPWIAYALVDGVDLDEWRRRHGRPDSNQLAAWSAQGARALSVVHEAGLVHRDVKPGNFMVREEDQKLVLVDFGIARAAERAEETLHTQEGVILGTPAYMAPELLRAVAPSPASDQWAWAAVLLELSTGAIPYGSNDPHEVIAMARRFDPSTLAVPGEAGAVLRRALASDPTQRFPDLTAMDRAMRGRSWEGIEPPATQLLGGAVAATAPAAPRRPWRAPWLVAALLAAVGLGFGLRPRPRPPPAATAPLPRATPSPEELQALRRALDEHEHEFRRLFTAGSQPDPWDWRALWQGSVEEKRYRGRKAFVTAAASPHWERFLEAVVRMLEATDRLPDGERLRWFREAYGGARLAESIQAVMGRGKGLSVDMAMDFLGPGLGDGNVPQAFHDLKVVRVAFLEVLDSIDRFAQRLGELPHPSRETRLLAAWAAFTSRRGDVPARLLATLAVGPAPHPDLDWIVVQTTASALSRDPQFMHWENPDALHTRQACALVPAAIEALLPRGQRLSAAIRRAEIGGYLWQAEVQARGLCTKPVRLPTDDMLVRIRGYLEDIEVARRTGWPPGDFLDRTYAALLDSQGQLEKRQDPAAEALGRELATLKELR